MISDATTTGYHWPTVGPAQDADYDRIAALRAALTELCDEFGFSIDSFTVVEMPKYRGEAPSITATLRQIPVYKGATDEVPDQSDRPEAEAS